MPHAIPHGAIVDASGDQLRGVEVPDVVEAEARQSQPSEPGEMIAVADVGRIERAAVLAHEKQSAVAVLRPHAKPQLLLQAERTSDRLDGHLRQQDRAAAALGLRPPLLLDYARRLAYPLS